MRLPGFVGASNPSRSRSASVERTTNLYPEMVDGSSGPAQTLLRGRPAVTPYCCLPSGPVRAMYSMDGRGFAVGGSRFYEIFADRTAVQRGVLAVDGNPATISSNGSAGYQMLVTSGGVGYRYGLKTNALAPVTDPDAPSPMTMAAFLDGYFIGLQGQSRQFKLSSLEDGATWDGLDVGEVSFSADNIRAMAILQRQVWFFGSKATNIWYNSGAESFALSPLGGALIEHGVLAPWSVQVLDNTLYFLGADANGQGQVWRMNGYTPIRISSNALEYQLSRSERLAEAIAWAMQYEGHTWYALYVPDLPTTWLYDVPTNTWVEWGVWDPDLMDFRPFPARCHCVFNGQHLVGDWTTGAIYNLSLDVHEDTIVEAA